jgi:hypothetical protein
MDCFRGRSDADGGCIESGQGRGGKACKGLATRGMGIGIGCVELGVCLSIICEQPGGGC